MTDTYDVISNSEELVRAMQVFGVDLEYFTDGFRLVGEGSFSWRAKNAAPGLLDKFEARAGRWIATYRNLGEGKDKPASPLQARLPLTERNTFEEARAAAEALGTEWDLGEIPAQLLEKRVRERLRALVLYVDAPAGISGADPCAALAGARRSGNPWMAERDGEQTAGDRGGAEMAAGAA